MLTRSMLAIAAVVVASLSQAIAPNVIADPQRRVLSRITWEDVQPLRDRLDAWGISPDTFPSFVERVHASNLQRVHEGDLDHLIFYTLQSTRFTDLPPVEPALSAKALVDDLNGAERETFLSEGGPSPSRIPSSAKARLVAMLRALGRQSTDPRLVYFRDLLDTSFGPAEREAKLTREYVRVMRFVYQKEYVAGRSNHPDDAVAALYRARGLSTDTEVEAGYLVYLGLGIVKSLDPNRRVRRVLIVGPGLDLAPRTSLVETGPPESYQPWAVIDALVTLRLARLDDLEVVGADINSRVVDHLRRAAGTPPTIHIVSGVQETDGVAFTADYREYFAGLGRGIGEVTTDGPTMMRTGRLAKRLRVEPAAARVLHAQPLDIVTERLDGGSFDVIIATNILPYFGDAELTLAIANIANMLAPGGVFLHNEARPLLGDVAAALGVPFVQSRHVTIASVRGAPAPLGDSIWIHRRAGG